jgi:hypothetical protein
MASIGEPCETNRVGKAVIEFSCAGEKAVFVVQRPDSICVMTVTILLSFVEINADTMERQFLIS